MAGTYAKYTSSGGGGGGGISTINGSNAPTQIITGGTGISVASAGGTTTITNTAVASNAFTIIQTDTGTSPTATSPTSTLTLHNTDGQISIAGNSTTNTATLNLNTTATLTELNYVHGVTSSIQTQLNAISSGNGIQRIISSVSTATTAGSTLLRDYVYFVSGTTTITLPTAVGNSNLYTIKNVGTNTVTISTTSSQTIDGSNTASLPVQYTSLDLLSNGVNWNVV